MRNRNGSPRSILVIFDCDGTLVDSEPLCGRALSLTCHDFGLAFDAEEYISHYKGMALSRIEQSIAAARQVPVPAGFSELYRHYVRTFFATELRIIAGIDAVLSALPYSMCVASNGPMEKIRLSLETVGLAPYFGDNLFSAYDVKFWKPEPELFLKCARHFSIPASRCIVVEDSEPGLLGARTAGMRHIYFAHNTRQAVSVTPHAIAHRAEELPQLISKLARH